MSKQDKQATINVNQDSVIQAGTIKVNEISDSLKEFLEINNLIGRCVDRKGAYPPPGVRE